MKDKSELLKELSDLNRAIYEAITKAHDFATEHDLEFINPVGSEVEYVQLNEEEAEVLRMKEGDYAWISSSTFC